MNKYTWKIKNCAYMAGLLLLAVAMAIIVAGLVIYGFRDWVHFLGGL